jgi:hypothetical protein
VALPDQRTRKWFLRTVYRKADPQTEAGREALLDGLDDVLWRQINAGGKRLTSTASVGTSASFEWAENMGLDDLASLTEWARGFISEADAEDALASVPGAVRMFRNETSVETYYG